MDVAQMAATALAKADATDKALSQHLQDCIQERIEANEYRARLEHKIDNGLASIHARMNTGLYIVLGTSFSIIGFLIVFLLENMK